MSSSHVAYLEIANDLREQILTGRLSAGDWLPTEADLCVRYRVSRSTIREALRMLSSQRLLATRRGVGGGSQVAQLRHEDVSEMLRDSILLLTNSEGCTAGELLEARKFLEVPVAWLAAERATSEQIDRLAATIPEVVQGHELDEAHANAGDFHAVLLDLAGNRLLRVVAEPLFQVIRLRYPAGHSPVEAWEQNAVEHRAIVEAIRTGDAARAGQLMATHLDQMRDTYEAIDGDRSREMRDTPSAV